jgi:23S rRNA (uracil1939-C5)-methyltransferase
MGKRSRNAKPLYEKVRIVDVGSEGKSIGKVDDVVVFVPYAIPGDLVDIQVIKNRKRFREGKVTHYHEYSPERVEAFCEHFGVCGGCKWQNLPYEKQLFYKQKQVNDQLTRIGKLQLPDLMPIIGSEKSTFYRNKLEFTFSNKRWLTNDEINSDNAIKNSNALGFHVPGLFDKVIDINKCWLQPDPSNAIRNSIKEFAHQNDYSFFDIKQQAGLLRNVVVRTSTTGEVMVIVSLFENDEPKINALLDMLAESIPEITSLMYVINQKGNDTILDQDILLYKGNDHIFETMEDLRFKIGPKSFYQTNSGQAYNLYKVTRDFAELKGNEVVYDLYTGTGTIANFVARSARKVIGIEYVPEAIEDAKINSALNGIDNVSFFAGDMKKVLNDDFIALHGKPDVIITDPPRAGMDTKVVETILGIAPERIVYVSCNPATQARDIEMLETAYNVAIVQPVDMFPHTHHVENVVLLRKRI